MADTTTPGDIASQIAILESQKALAEAAYNQTLSQIAQDRGNFVNKYGFTADFDPNGNLKTYRQDSNNPNGLLQQLQQAQGSSLDNVYHNATSRGLGHLGLGAQGEQKLRYLQGIQTDQLGKNFITGIDNFVRERQSAFNTMQSASLMADLAIAGLIGPPADSGGGGVGAPATTQTDPGAPAAPVPQNMAVPSVNPVAAGFRATMPRQAAVPTYNFGNFGNFRG